MKAVVDVGASGVKSALTCESCGRPPQAGCGTCARRSRERRRGEALALVERGVPLKRAARSTGTHPSTLRRALRRQPTTASIENAPLRRAVDAVMQDNKALTFTEIARRADPPFGDGAHVARLLGRLRTSPRRRGDRVYPARFRTEISLDAAARIVRATGVDPVDIGL